SRTVSSETIPDDRTAIYKAVDRSRESSCGLLVLPVSPDQICRRAVVLQRPLFLRFELRNDLLREHLAEFNAPLIERIDSPNHALYENRMFIKRDQFPERFGRKALRKNCVRWAISVKDSMRH